MSEYGKLNLLDAMTPTIIGGLATLTLIYAGIQEKQPLFGIAGLAFLGLTLEGLGYSIRYGEEMLTHEIVLEKIRSRLDNQYIINP